MLREQIYHLVKRSPYDQNLTLGKVYDIIIVIVSLLSVTPLIFRESNYILEQIDIITVYILFIDYVFRWICYDYIIRRQTYKAFIIYPFMPFHLINLISLLPSLGLLAPGWKILRMVRVIVAFSYSKSFLLVFHAFRKEWHAFSAVLVIAVTYIFISALAIFTLEPETFDSFFDAVYWSTTALTTVGYGDIYPVTDIGKIISMVSSFFGIAVVALPAGIITASFVEEINKFRAEKEKTQENFNDSTSILDRIFEKEQKENNDREET